MITPSFALTATERLLPKLALDFTTASLDSRVTFTRTTGASNPATFVDSNGYVTVATNNQPRFDYDPISKVCKGLLIEGSRSNLITSSEDVQGTGWISTNMLFSANAETSPANTLTADKVMPNTTASVSHTVQAPTFTPLINTSYTYSSFFKAAGYPRVVMTFTATTSWSPSNPNVTFDLSTGTVVSANNGAVATIEAFDNGWYRCSIKATTAGTVVSTIRPYFVVDNGSGTTFTGNGTDGIFAWGAQLEVGAFATSYIPTTTAALTRNADVAVMTGTNFSDWFNVSEGSAVIQVLPSTISGTRPAVEFDDSTVNEAIVLRGVAADPQLYVVDGGTAQATLDAGLITANMAYKLGGAWKASSFAASVNGGGSVSQLSGTYPTVTQARLGSDGVNFLNGCLQNLRYWTQRLTNAEVQAFSK